MRRSTQGRVDIPEARLDVRAIHEERRARFDAARERAARRSRTIAHIRLILAALAIAGLVWRGPAAEPARIAGTAAAVAFMALVAVHARVRREERSFAQRAAVNAEALRRLAHDWDALPSLPPPAVDEGHPYAADLDLFGHASLWRLLGVVSAAPGRQTLASWLLAPAPAPEIRARQLAIAELSPQLDLRDALTIRARAVGEVTPADLDRFLEWCEERPWLAGRPALSLLVRALPAATVLLIAAQASGVVDAAWWAIPLVLGVPLLAWQRNALAATLRRTGARATALRSYAALFELLGAMRPESPLLRRHITPFAGGDGGAAARMQSLQRLMELAEVRFSPMLHGVLQLLLLWDFQVVRGLERWRARAGVAVRGWLEALGAVEALAALATLRHDNPDWHLPEIREAGPAMLEAEALGHPLIPRERCVRNDVEVGPPGTFLLITGSNMSGKSTLLRAIGLGAVMAQAGAPVCAAALRLTPVRPYTSMRIHDSLEAGLSFFMAELMRLKAIVDAARAPGAPLLYLLDELLQGTNTAERQIAARTIVAHLLERDAIGAVTTHDLALADTPELLAAARPVHFTETVVPDAERGTMTFDYRLRAGLATSANALKLMEMLGLR